MKWCIKIRDNFNVDRNNGALVRNTIYNSLWNICIENQSNIYKSGLDYWDFQFAQNFDGNAFSCNEKVQWGDKWTTLLRMPITISRAQWKKRLKLKAFWIFYKHFSFILANDVWFLLLFFLLKCQSMRSGKNPQIFFSHVHKYFRYRITIPKNYTTRMSITGRQSFCIRAAPALFSEELMYAIRSEWFFSKPFFLHSWCKWNCYRSYIMVLTSFLDSLG